LLVTSTLSIMFRVILLVLSAACLVNDWVDALPAAFDNIAVPNNAKATFHPSAVHHKGQIHLFYQGNSDARDLWKSTWSPGAPSGGSWGAEEQITKCGQMLGAPASASDGESIYVVTLYNENLNIMAMMKGKDGIAPINGCPPPLTSAPNTFLVTYESPSLVYIPSTSTLLLITMTSDHYMTWSTLESGGSESQWSTQQVVITTSNGFVGMSGTASPLYDIDTGLVHVYHNGWYSDPPLVLRTTFDPIHRTWSQDTLLQRATGSYSSGVPNWIPRASRFYDPAGVGQNIYQITWPYDQSAIVTDYNQTAGGLLWAEERSSSVDQSSSSCSEMVSWTSSGTTYIACFYKGKGSDYLWFTGYQTSVTPCPLGQKLVSGTTCVACPAGTYKDTVGFGECKPCASGYFSTAGSVQCSLCPENTFWQAPNTCAKCPSSAPYSLPGATSSSECCTAGNAQMSGSLKLLTSASVFYDALVALKDVNAPADAFMAHINAFIKQVSASTATHTIEQQVAYLASISPVCPHA